MAVETLLIAWGYVLSGVFSVIIIYFLSEGFPETSSFEWSVCFVLGPFILALFFGFLVFEHSNCKQAFDYWFYEYPIHV